MSFDFVNSDINWITFYPRDALHSAVFAVVRCLSVCPSVRLSHAGIVSKQLNHVSKLLDLLVVPSF